MIIKKHDMFAIKLNIFSNLNIYAIIKPVGGLYYVRQLLIYSFGSIRRIRVLCFIENMKTKYKNGISYEEVDINIDNENDLVYLSESYHTYDTKPMTKEIDDLFEAENFIELCKIGFLDYDVMTKENFIHILLLWDKILDQVPPFALLYQDDKNWFDVLPFDTQEAMEKFVADHTKLEETQK